jgi:hypothetical protein
LVGEEILNNPEHDTPVTGCNAAGKPLEVIGACMAFQDWMFKYRTSANKLKKEIARKF